MSGEMTINQKDIDQVYQWLYKDAEPGWYHLNTSGPQRPEGDVVDQSSEDDIVHHLHIRKYEENMSCLLR
jgi:hypothetical protein